MINQHDIKDMQAFNQPKANDKQVDGNHYKKYGNLQPWDVVLQWNLGYLEGTALKYIARWQDKGGIADIKKAIHFLEKLVEQHTPVNPLVSSQNANMYNLTKVMEQWLKHEQS
jgi:hypothetical protein